MRPRERELRRINDEGSVHEVYERIGFIGRKYMDQFRTHLLRFQNVTPIHNYKKHTDLLVDLNKMLLPNLETMVKKLNRTE